MVSFPIGLQFAIYQHPRARLLNLKMIIFFLFLNVSEVDLKEPPVCRGVNYPGSQLGFVSFRWYEQSPKKDPTLLLPAVKKEPCAATTANIVQITLKFPWFSVHLAPGERHSSSEVIYSVTSAHSAIMTTIYSTQSNAGGFCERPSMTRVRKVIIQNNLTSCFSSAPHSSAELPKCSPIWSSHSDQSLQFS